MLLADMTWSQLLLGLVIIGVCFFLVVVILLQRGRGGGLAGAFGGGGGSGTFGAKTGDVFTWITVAFAGVFLLLAIFANFVFDRSEFALETPAVAETPAGAPAGNATGAAPEGGVTPKIEFVTEDGQVLPAGVDVKVVPPDGAQPAQPGDQPGTEPGTPVQPSAQPPTQPTDPGAATPPPADQPQGGNQGQTNDNAAPEEPKDPGL